MDVTSTGQNDYAQKAVSRTSPVGERFDELMATVEGLRNSVDRMINRISPILNPNDMSPAVPAEDRDRRSQSEVSNSLDNCREQLIALTNWVNDTIERIEV